MRTPTIRRASDRSAPCASAAGVCGARQPQRAIERIARRRDEAARRLGAHPARHVLGKPAGEREPFGAERHQPRSERVDMAGRQPHELDRDRIVPLRVLHHARRERGEIARRRSRGPAHDRVRIRLELLVERGKQGGPVDAPVARPQHAAQRLAPEECAAALVRHRQAPAAHPIVPAVELGPADAAGAHDDDAAVPALMGTDTGGMRVARHDRAAERMAAPLGGGKLGRLGGPGQGKAGGGPAEVARRQPGLAQAGEAHLQHRRESLRQSAANIGRSSGRLGELLARGGGQAGPAAGSAAVDPEKERT